MLLLEGIFLMIKVRLSDSVENDDNLNKKTMNNHSWLNLSEPGLRSNFPTDSICWK